MDSDSMVHKFDMIDRHGWPQSQIEEEALAAAERRGEMLGFYPARVEVKLGPCTRDGQHWEVKVYGKYTNEYLA